MTTDTAVPVEVAAHALRRIRPSSYRIGAEADQSTITLTVNAGAAGRHNAARRIVAALADAGIGMLADDPTSALAHGASLVLAHLHR